MSDELEVWYRAAIAETMRLCPEWHEPLFSPPTRDRAPRARKGRPVRRCDVCNVVYSASYLTEHQRRIHGLEVAS